MTTQHSTRLVCDVIKLLAAKLSTAQKTAATVYFNVAPLSAISNSIPTLTTVQTITRGLAS
ncbi:MAG: hypothetical protein ACI8WB_005469 [Phenylobacterium sp.]|jgi:hypothetical protein